MRQISDAFFNNIPGFETLNRYFLYLLPIFAYLIGSVPWGFVFIRLSGREDIRHSGSGNIGATNVRRVAGNRLALLTLAADMLKGAIPVWIATVDASAGAIDVDSYSALVALLAVLGHLFPAYFRLKKGGRGVATAAGCFWVLAPSALIFVTMVFVIAVWISDRVSVGSLFGAAVLPVAVWIATRSAVIAGCALIVSCLIFFRHKENIKRLLSGKEPRFRTKRPKCDKE